MPDRILDLSSYGERRFEEADGAAECRRLLLLYQAVRAAIDHQSASAIRPILTIVSSLSQSVQTEDRIDPGRAAIPALVLSMAQESDRMIAKHVDLAPVEDDDSLIQRLVQEACTSDVEREIAYRNGRRLVARVARADLTWSADSRPPFARGGLYLVSGGLSAIGVQLSRFLVERYGVRLVLTGRRPANSMARPTRAARGVRRSPPWATPQCICRPTSATSTACTRC